MVAIIPPAHPQRKQQTFRCSTSSALELDLNLAVLLGDRITDVPRFFCVVALGQANGHVTLFFDWSSL